ncbi:MAG: hypothetical protein WAQ02_00080 [Methanosarcina flavescens]
MASITFVASRTNLDNSIVYKLKNIIRGCIMREVTDSSHLGEGASSPSPY